MHPRKQRQLSAAITTALVIAVFCALFFFTYWSDEKHAESVRAGEFLPYGFTDLVDVGDGWQEFTYKNQRFLYHHASSGYWAYECIVKIDSPVDVKEE
jgi:hypothetical protein